MGEKWNLWSLKKHLRTESTRSKCGLAIVLGGFAQNWGNNVGTINNDNGRHNTPTAPKQSNAYKGRLFGLSTDRSPPPSPTYL